MNYNSVFFSAATRRILTTLQMLPGRRGVNRAGVAKKAGSIFSSGMVRW